MAAIGLIREDASVLA